MDWQNDTPPYILHQATAPWNRSPKRSFATFLADDDAYKLRTLSAKEGAEVRHRPIDQGYAPHQSERYGNQQQLEQYHEVLYEQQHTELNKAPHWVQLLIIGAFFLVKISSELIGLACRHTAIAAVQVAATAKRRMISVTRDTPVPVPQRRSSSPPQRRSSPLFRQSSATSPGRHSTVRLRRPRFRPKPHTEAALEDARRSREEYSQSLVMLDTESSTSNNAEYLMSGALQDTDTNEYLISDAIQNTETHTEPPMTPILHIRSSNPAHRNTLQSSYDTRNPLSPYHLPGLPGMFLESPSHQKPPTEPVQSSIVDRIGDSMDPMVIDEAVHDNLGIPEIDGAESETSNNSMESMEEDVESITSNASEDSGMHLEYQPRNYDEVIPYRSYYGIDFVLRANGNDEVQAATIDELQAAHDGDMDVDIDSTLGLDELSRPGTTLVAATKGLDDLQRSPLKKATSNWTHISASSPAQAQVGLSGMKQSPVIETLTTVGQTDEAPPSWIQASDGLNHSTQTLPIAVTSYQPEKSVLIPPQSRNGLYDFYLSPPTETTATETTTTASSLIGTDPGLKDSTRSPPSETEMKRSQEGDSTPCPSRMHNGLIEFNRSPLSEIAVYEENPFSASPMQMINGSNGSIRSPLSGIAANQILNTSSTPTQKYNSALSAFFRSSSTTSPHDHGGTLGTRGINQSTPTTSSPLRSSLTARTTRRSPSPPRGITKFWPFSITGLRKKPKSPSRQSMSIANATRVSPKTPRKTVGFYESPKTGRPVTGVKRFVTGESISHPSPVSSREDSSILSSIAADELCYLSPTVQEQAFLDAQLQSAISMELGDTMSMDSASVDYSDGAVSSQSIDESGTSPASAYDFGIAGSSESSNEQRTSTNPTSETVSSPSSGDNTSLLLEQSTLGDAIGSEPATPQVSLTQALSALSVSGRRSTLRSRQKQQEEERLRAEQAEIATKEKARRDKEEAEEKARKDAEEEEERKKDGIRRIPKKKVIQPLSKDWDDRVSSAMNERNSRKEIAHSSAGNAITRYAFGKVLPQRGAGDDLAGWLNDEIIDAYLQAVVDHGQAPGYKRGDTPRLHAFTSFFHKQLNKEGGADNVKRWAKRAKIGGKDLLKVEWVFVPVHMHGNHWTLLVISPTRKTIEFFDSMHGYSTNPVKNIKAWIKFELGSAYKEEEWKLVEDERYRGKGKGPTQDNVSDCGMFSITTAKMVSLGVDPMAVSAADMPLQRRRVVAELINGGFTGDFEPKIEFD